MRKQRWSALATLVAIGFGTVITVLAPASPALAAEVTQYTPKIRVPAHTQLRPWIAKCPLGYTFKGASPGQNYPAHYHERTTALVHAFTERGMIGEESDRQGGKTGRHLIKYLISNTSSSAEVIRLRYVCESIPGRYLESTTQKWPDFDFDCVANADTCQAHVDGAPSPVPATAYPVGGNAYTCGKADSEYGFSWSEQQEVGWDVATTTTNGFEVSVGLTKGAGNVGVAFSSQISSEYRRSWRSQSGVSRTATKYVKPRHKSWLTFTPKLSRATGSVRLEYGGGLAIYPDPVGQNSNNTFYGGTLPLSSVAPDLLAPDSSGRTYLDGDISMYSRRMTAVEERDQCAGVGGVALAEPAAGGLFRINERKSLLAWDVYGGFVDNGTRLQLWPEHTHVDSNGETFYNQNFRLESAGDYLGMQTFRIVAVSSSTPSMPKCVSLDLYVDSGPLAQQPCSNVPKQRFVLESAGQLWQYLKPVYGGVTTYIASLDANGACATGPGYNLFVTTREKAAECGQYGFRWVSNN